MQNERKDEKAILKKLGIDQLNEMQNVARSSILNHSEVVLLSPTGTGKTLAFLLPIISTLDRQLNEVQVLILAPSRELAIQIEQVTREMGSGFKANAIYGGRPIAKDRIDLATPPAILIGTPGRIADHIRRGTVSFDFVKTLVLDEFDKSLEIGFSEDMEKIIDGLSSIEKKVLTSATQKIEIPDFAEIYDPEVLNFLDQKGKQLQIQQVIAPNKDKLETLVKLLRHLGKSNGIIFCNFKDTIQFVSDHLYDEGIDHGCFYGGLEQQERERALIKFRNGTDRLLIATDLAARGIDVPEMDFIIHYQLPLKKEEFVHRNGRTARMHQEGTAYVLKWEGQELPDFIQDVEIIEPQPKKINLAREWETLFISGGRKDKISKGDIAGLFFKQGNLQRDELGMIELKRDCAFVSVPYKKASSLAKALNNTRLKKKKVRINILS